MGCEFSGLSEEWRQRITSIHDTTSFIILNTIMCNHSYSTTHQLSLENIDCTQIKYLFINLGSLLATIERLRVRVTLNACHTFPIYRRFYDYRAKKKNPIAIHFGVGVRNLKGAGLEEGSHFVNIAVWRSNRPGAYQRDCNFSHKWGRGLNWVTQIKSTS